MVLIIAIKKSIKTNGDVSWRYRSQGRYSRGFHNRIVIIVRSVLVYMYVKGVELNKLMLNNFQQKSFINIVKLEITTPEIKSTNTRALFNNFNLT